jgi:hypothetical protein
MSWAGVNRATYIAVREVIFALERCPLLIEDLFKLAQSILEHVVVVTCSGQYIDIFLRVFFEQHEDLGQGWVDLWRSLGEQLDDCCEKLVC